MIDTPPNIIISTYCASRAGEPFGLFDVLNNAAAAVLMAPIAYQLAEGAGHSPDSYS